MRITFIKHTESGDYSVYSLSGESRLTQVGTISKHRAGFYIFNDALYRLWWNDTDIKGLMEEIRRYYNE